MALFYSLSLTVFPQVFWRQQNIRRTHCGLVLFLVINCSSHRCFGDSRTSGGPIVALFYSFLLTILPTGVLETAEHQEDPLWPCSIPCH